MRLVDVLGKYDNFQDAYKKFEIISCMENSIKKDKDEFLSSGFMELHPLDDIEYNDFEMIEGMLSDIFITEKICPVAEVLIKVLKSIEDIANAVLDHTTVYYNTDKYNKTLKQTSDLISCLEDGEPCVTGGCWELSTHLLKTIHLYPVEHIDNLLNKAENGFIDIDPDDEDVKFLKNAQSNAKLDAWQKQEEAYLSQIDKLKVEIERLKKVNMASSRRHKK